MMAWCGGWILRLYLFSSARPCHPCLPHLIGSNPCPKSNFPFPPKPSPRAAESSSGHYLGNALIAKAKEKNLSVPSSEAFENDLGLGIAALVEGQRVLVGNRSWLESQGISAQPLLEAANALAVQGKTPVLLALDGKAAASFGIETVIAHAGPARKLEIIRELQLKGGRVGMVADGVNDATALAAADVGFRPFPPFAPAMPIGH